MMLKESESCKLDYAKFRSEKEASDNSQRVIELALRCGTETKEGQWLSSVTRKSNGDSSS